MPRNWHFSFFNIDFFLYFEGSYDIMFKVHFKKGMKEMQFD